MTSWKECWMILMIHPRLPSKCRECLTVAQLAQWM
jgi:hypothetical protein